jgi:transposase
MGNGKRDDVSSTLWGIHGFRVASCQVEETDRGREVFVVRLENVSGGHVCPTCGKRDDSQRRLAFEEAEPRRWRDCSLGQYETYVEITPWRLFCCGATRVEVFDWEAPGDRRMTKRLFERIAALCIRLPIQEVAGMFRMAWQTVSSVDKAATRLALGGERPDFGKPRWIGVDEVSRTGGHVYFTIVSDLESGRVIYVGDGKGEESLAAFFDELGPRGCRRIRGVVSDLGSGWLPAITKHIPRATHVLDRFHIVQWLNEALNKVRRRIFGGAPKGALGKELKAAKWLLLSAYETLSHGDKLLLARLEEANKPIYDAHLLKSKCAGSCCIRGST